MGTMMKYIAERKLLFSEKTSQETKEIVVKISEPFVATEGNANFPGDGVASVCRVEIDGLDEPGFDLVGMDSLQAVNLASDIESLIKRLSDKYDFFWITGEPYFDETQARKPRACCRECSARGCPLRAYRRTYLRTVWRALRRFCAGCKRQPV